MNHAGVIRIRDVTAHDFPRMYEMQLDPESNRMAVTNARSAEAFDTHWRTALQDPDVAAKVILIDDEVVGYVSRFQNAGAPNVGYWIGREHWGKGLASRGLELLLQEVKTRPLFAQAATSNLASLRVLQKCGFVIEKVHVAPGCDRYPECEVAVLVLKPESPG